MPRVGPPAAAVARAGGGRGAAAHHLDDHGAEHELLLLAEIGSEVVGGRLQQRQTMEQGPVLVHLRGASVPLVLASSPVGRFFLLRPPGHSPSELFSNTNNPKHACERRTK